VAAQVGRGEITLPEAEEIIKKAKPAKPTKDKPKTESENANKSDEPKAESEAESQNANVGVLADSEPSPASEEPADVASESAPPIQLSTKCASFRKWLRKLGVAR